MDWSVDVRCCRRCASARTQPVTVTSPAGGGGYVVGVGAAVVGGQPAPVDQQRGAVGRDEGYHDVDARGAVAGAVADDHGVVGVVRRRSPVTSRHSRLPRTRSPAASTSRDRDRVGRSLALDDRVALLAVLEPVELPLAEPPRQPGQQHHHEREEDPASAEQERQGPHAAKATGAPRRGTATRMTARPLGCDA